MLIEIKLLIEIKMLKDASNRELGGITSFGKYGSFFKSVLMSVARKKCAWQLF